MPNEIESKYLCEYLPENIRGSRLVKQGYIHIDHQKQIRIRLTEGEANAEMCIKYMGNVRKEFNAILPWDEGEKLYDLCRWKVEKARYTSSTEDGCHVDIDVYEDGTIIAEIERPTYEYKPVLRPYMLGCVDKIFRYSNYYFAGMTPEEYAKSN